VDTDYFGGFGATQLSQTWAPDNKWIAYAKQLPSGQHAVFVYSLEQGKSHQITDGMSDALYPSFDKNGTYLYFTASTDVGLSTSGLDMSSDEHRVSRSAYVAVLNKDLPSPLAPESDEEARTKIRAKPTKHLPTRIRAKTAKKTRTKLRKSQS
jgi:tricorn protease